MAVAVQCAAQCAQRRPVVRRRVCGPFVIVRNVVENKVNFANTRNVIVAALILVLAIGINYSVGSIKLGIVSLSGLAVASIVGIVLNAVLPGKDYEFSQDDEGSTSVNFKV